MKKQLLYAAFAVLTITTFSCKKDSDNPDYYLKMKVNGSWITYTTAIAENGPDLGDPSLHDLVVNGYSSDQKDIFSIAIQKNEPIGTGTYHTDNTTYWSFVDWFVGSNTADFRVYEQDPAPNQPDSKFTINITSITDKEIRGNFTGNYLYDEWETVPNDVLRTVTEGEFVAKRMD